MIIIIIRILLGVYHLILTESWTGNIQTRRTGSVKNPTHLEGMWSTLQILIVIIITHAQQVSAIIIFML